ncbi:hypothetical protein B0J12DRAFT_574156 [Macrophomina phaseolina]|uniref:Uncharacterized protein n=1 Tax=Macrophomina phaseolina TaxID=35725 RepID=A0ABQ8G9P9_9PEZI|nr:hypothetical protein B0J12DRAFT_574156 [Macrophomina phaseolina]
MPDLFALRINVAKEPVHEVEEKAERTARTVKHLLHANHSIFSVIYHNLEFHNHVPHILGSAYILGSTNEHLNEVYDVETETLERWTDSPGEITEENWRDHFGQKEYQRAYMDFFEDQIPKHGHDWKAMTEHYLFEGPHPLINNVICGLGHALIHLGYAYELSSRTLATEALVLSTCFRNSMHKYLDDPAYTRPSPHPSSSPLDLLRRIRADARFDGLFRHKGDTNIYELLDRREDAVLEYWNALAVPDNPTLVFGACQRAAVDVFVATRGEGEKHDFFFVHLLTASHALRHLLPALPARWHVPLARQWWLFVVTIYVAQHRPEVRRERIEEVELAGRDWAWVVREALEGRWRNDPHFVKALRAMKNAAETWGDESQFLLKAAVKFATDFGGWGGFAPAEIVRTDERKQARMGLSSEEIENARDEAEME